MSGLTADAKCVVMLLCFMECHFHVCLFVTNNHIKANSLLELSRMLI